jgi:trehalose 6-phosphate synthase
MDVVSYRGPGVAGGVSSGLGNAWRKDRNGNTRWWFVCDQSINVLSKQAQQSQFVTHLSESVINGHYRYCNEFLWPVLHDLPEHATYRPEDRAQYRRFNARFAQFIAFERQSLSPYFIQDYQLALLPELLQNISTIAFWHIPWPKNVPQEFREPMSEIARGLLSAQVLGFHTAEYVTNFMNFVCDNLAEYSVDWMRSMVSPVFGRTSPSLIEVASTQSQSNYVLRPLTGRSSNQLSSATKLVVKPLGIDTQQWQETAAATPISQLADKLPEGILQKPFVLSVDRADYTKAVLERLTAIDKFMEKRQEAIGQVSFVQICGRSRSGLTAFDRYWEECRTLGAAVNDRWRTADWQPVQWLEKPLNAIELSALYRRASVMLVNPVRDGLNLTAKEFTACQGDDAAPLLLSPAAGCWHELGKYSLPAHPQDLPQMLDSLERAFEMSAQEKQTRNAQAKLVLEKGSLQSWWRYFERVSYAIASGANRNTATLPEQRKTAQGAGY